MNDLQLQFENHTHDGVNSKQINQSVFICKSLESTQAATASNYGVFFVATRPCVVKAISESHTVAGSAGGAVTLTVERLKSGQALDSGTEMLTTPFDLKSIANTPVRGAIARIPTGLSTGDRLALKDSGTLTSVAGVTINVELGFQ